MYRMFTISLSSECAVNIDYCPIQFSIDIILDFDNTNTAFEHKVRNSPVSFIFFYYINLFKWYMSKLTFEFSFTM